MNTEKETLCVVLGPDLCWFGILDNDNLLMTWRDFTDIKLNRSLRCLLLCLHCLTHGEASTRWCSVPTHTLPFSASCPTLQAGSGQKIWLIFPFLAAASSTGALLPINHLSQPNTWNAAGLSPSSCCLGHKISFQSLKNWAEGRGLKHNNFWKGSGRIAACQMQHLDRTFQWRKDICIRI